jgi:hypothetical protein
MSKIMQKALLSKAARSKKKLSRIALAGSEEAFAWV